ncbi:putative transposable element [Trichonephila clavipes]|nr:putative transposable element [Trichonephila clavipes]
MLTLWGYFEGYRNRDPKHNVRQASYRNRNTTWDRYQTGIETQRGTGWLWGFKREPYIQRGPTYTSCRRGFKWESRPNVGELWFQQDGATCHTARATIDLLKDTLGDHLISRFGPVNWPPRSCDLTQLDYFLWGYVKSLVYANKPQTLDHLEDNIRRVIADIRPQMLEKVIENWTSRLDYIRASRGFHMPEIIFKM